jgi:Kef-type K+ transport system membrane component KefB
LLALVCVAVAAWPRTAWAAEMSSETFSRILLLFSAVGAGYLITHLVVERLSRRFTIAGGIEYVLLGIVLGPALGLLEPDMVRDIRPVLMLGAGALGMLAGLELAQDGARGPDRTSAERQTDRGSWTVAIAVTLATLVMVVGLPLGLMLAVGVDVLDDHAWTGALLAAGVVALGAEGTIVEQMTRYLGAHGFAPEQGVVVARRTTALAAVGFGVLYSLLEPNSVLSLREPTDFGQMLAIQVGAGSVLGGLFSVIVHRRLEDRVLLTVLVGMVLLASGFAYALEVSGIFVNFVAGLVFALTSRHARDARRMLHRLERPFVIALYFFAGLEWIVGELWVFALVPVFMLLRWAGRRLGGLLSARRGGAPLDLAPATVAPGGLTIALMLSVVLVYRQVPGMQDAYAPLLIAVVLLEAASLRVVRRWLLDVADVPPEGRIRQGFVPDAE